jgi:hypothetical protein
MQSDGQHSLNTSHTAFCSANTRVELPSAVPIPASVFMLAPALLGFLDLRPRKSAA